MGKDARKYCGTGDDDREYRSSTQAGSRTVNKLIEVVCSGKMQVLGLDDCEALFNRGLVLDHPDTTFVMSKEVVQVVRCWGRAKERIIVPSPMFGKQLKRAAFRSMEMVAELERVARSQEYTMMDGVVHHFLDDLDLLVVGPNHDPMPTEESRKFFRQFPEPAQAIGWAVPESPER
ncbi:MAG: hypothetical protein ACRCZE_00075 [Candidatus Altimarinota bacterium]